MITRQWGLAVLGVSFTLCVLTASYADIPFPFSPGQVIKASEVNANFQAVDSSLANQQATYRWNVFDTYDQSGGWLCAGDPGLFGGVHPGAWTDGGARASLISANKDVQRTLFQRQGFAGKNSLVYSHTGHFNSSTNGQIVTALFRVKNTTGSGIPWNASFYYTSNPGWAELASVAVNGQGLWESGGHSYGSNSQSVIVPIPANRTSTVIFVSATSPPTNTGNVMLRSTVLAFNNNCLQLPTGLKFVDDLSTATGDYSQ